MSKFTWQPWKLKFLPDPALASLKTYKSIFLFSGLPKFAYQGCHISVGYRDRIWKTIPDIGQNVILKYPVNGIFCVFCWSFLHLKNEVWPPLPVVQREQLVTICKWTSFTDAGTPGTTISALMGMTSTGASTCWSHSTCRGAGWKSLSWFQAHKCNIKWDNWYKFVFYKLVCLRASCFSWIKTFHRFHPYIRSLYVQWLNLPISVVRGDVDWGDIH